MATDFNGQNAFNITDRRRFLKNISVVSAAFATTDLWTMSAAGQENMSFVNSEAVPRRAFGRTGVQVSILGIGGYTIGEAKTEAEGIRIIHKAMDAGINFMDNSWEYHYGRSEEWMGKALKGKGGVMEAIAQAKQQGKVRFVGFTGHKDPAIHLKMLAYDFPFDACQLPLGPFDATFRSFEQKVLPELNRRGIAPIGMKSLGGTAESVKKGVLTAKEALTYVMSLPIAILVSGMDSLEVLNENLEIARSFTPMKPEAMQALRDRCAIHAADGRFELYKTSKRFDGPPGREQHGFPSAKEMEG